jgi:UDP-GlcNAc3NAcA epimerase
MRTIMTVVGARPQFIKVAAVSRHLRKCSGVREILVHTGQHFDANMSEIFFADLNIPPADINLGISGESHGDMTGRMLMALEAQLIALSPDWVLVYGDTNSTLAGALAAAKLGIPVAHVEAGLRSFNRRMPEEINRVLTDRLSRLLFCPTATAVRNLQTEGIRRGVHHTGDVMYDVLQSHLHRARSGAVLERLALSAGRYTVATVHRAENTDDDARLRTVFAFLEEQGKRLPVVMPLHPRTRRALVRAGLAPVQIRVTDPLGYLDMLQLVAGAAEIYTDSGGLQKEACFLRKPCVTLRDETEWPETIAAGWNRLWTVPGYAPRRDIAGFGDGNASSMICALLLQASGRAPSA